MAFVSAWQLSRAPFRRETSHQLARYKAPARQSRPLVPHRVPSVRMTQGRGSLEKWTCVESCGACCWLGDYDIETLTSLLKSPDDVEEYLGMIGADGWCTFFDKNARACTKYAERPRFCRVSFNVFHSLYGVQTEEEMNSFAIECCETHISDVYIPLGEAEESPEMERFRKAIGAA